MPRGPAPTRHLDPREDGYTVIEMMVAMSALAIALTIFTSLLINVQTNVGAQTDRSVNEDQGKLAMEQLDREIRSGNILYDPLVDDPTGFRLRVYTQTNGTPFRCVEWRVSGGDLLRRQRDPGYGLPWPANWRIVAEHVVNVDRGVKAFTLDPDPTKGFRTLDVTIIVNVDPSHPTSDVKLSQAITGRNTSYGYPVSVCDPKPS